jgi:hypothetical protein
VQNDRRIGRQDAPDFTKEIKPSKHFRNTWLRKWNLDVNELRSMLIHAQIVKTGKT